MPMMLIKKYSCSIESSINNKNTIKNILFKNYSIKDINQTFLFNYGGSCGEQY